MPPLKEVEVAGMFAKSALNQSLGYGSKTDKLNDTMRQLLAGNGQFPEKIGQAVGKQVVALTKVT